MATTLEQYAPFDSGAGSSVTEATWRAFMRHPVQSGVLINQRNQCAVYGDSSGRQVKVPSGECWIQGHWGMISTETILPIAANTSGSTRTDRVVIRADFINNRIELDVVTGGAAVTQNTSIWEISIALVTVVNGASTIAAGDVADDRLLVGNIKTVFFPKATQTGFGTLTAGSTATIATVSVPNLGYPYRLQCSGGVEYTIAETETLVDCQITYDSTVTGTNRIAGGLAKWPGTSGSDSKFAYAISDTCPSLTGAHTVRLLVKNQSGATTMTIQNSNKYTYSVIAIPT